MFTTDMGSLAFEYLHALYSTDSAIMEIMPDAKDHPSPVRSNHPVLQERIMDLREAIEDEIIGWVAAVYLQERGTHDVSMLDEKYDNKLTRHGIAERAWEIAYPNKDYPGLNA